MNNKRFLLTAFLISVAALGLRLYRLGEMPVSLNWDEVSWGYNAWSILKTGRDEYGRFLPLIFKAFGDYKAPVYVYLTSLSIAVFGLSEFAIRFPAAVFGALDIFLLMIFVRTLFKSFEQRDFIALSAGLWLTFSPWHYDYSHGAWEGNVLFAFYLVGIILFLQAIRGRGRRIYWSAFFFGLCFYVYNSAKLILPLTGLGLLVIYRRRFFKQIPAKKWLPAGLLLAIMILPVAYFTFFQGAGGRLKVMSIFSYPRPEAEIDRIETAEQATPQSFKYQLFHNDFHFFFRGILLRYLNHFSPRFLFFEGDWTDYRHGIPDFGVLNYFDFLLLFLGVYFLLSRKIENQAFIWFLLAIGPLPAALTRDIIQSLRSYFLVIPLAIISAFGMIFLYKLLKKTKKYFRIPLGLGLVGGYFFVFCLFWDRYFIHAAYVNSGYWQYGYKEAVRFIQDKVHQYDQVVFTSKYGQPYIYYLFYSQYPPAAYQPQAHLTEHPGGDVGKIEAIDNLVFKELYWPGNRFEANKLFVSSTFEIPDQDIRADQARVLKDIYFLNGELAFRIVETVSENNEN